MPIGQEVRWGGGDEFSLKSYTLFNVGHISNMQKNVCLKLFSEEFYDTRIVVIAVKYSNAKKKI